MKLYRLENNMHTFRWLADQFNFQNTKEVQHQPSVPSCAIDSVCLFFTVWNLFFLCISQIMLLVCKSRTTWSRGTINQLFFIHGVCKVNHFFLCYAFKCASNGEILHHMCVRWPTARCFTCHYGGYDCTVSQRYLHHPVYFNRLCCWYSAIFGGYTNGWLRHSYDTNTV